MKIQLEVVSHWKLVTTVNRYYCGVLWGRITTSQSSMLDWHGNILDQCFPTWGSQSLRAAVHIFGVVECYPCKEELEWHFCYCHHYHQTRAFYFSVFGSGSQTQNCHTNDNYSSFVGALPGSDPTKDWEPQCHKILNSPILDTSTQKKVTLQSTGLIPRQVCIGLQSYILLCSLPFIKLQALPFSGSCASWSAFRPLVICIIHLLTFWKIWQKSTSHSCSTQHARGRQFLIRLQWARNGTLAMNTVEVAVAQRIHSFKCCSSQEQDCEPDQGSQKQENPYSEMCIYISTRFWNVKLNGTSFLPNAFSSNSY